jgi:hypothetical protein
LIESIVDKQAGLFLAGEYQKFIHLISGIFTCFPEEASCWGKRNKNKEEKCRLC